jgi:hypothetical protein
MKNTLINRKVTAEVARALDELNAKVVYVGGAVVSLYIDDPSAEDVRPTGDIDISMEIAGINELEKIRETLQQKGFRQSHEDDVICRFRYNDIKVDVMATRPVGWAPANAWFEPGFRQLKRAVVEGIEIRILSLPYFLATKFSAFEERGKADPRTSKDMDDITYLLNYTSDLQAQIFSSPGDVKEYLKKCFLEIQKNDMLQEAIIANLYYENRQKRYEKILSRLKDITDVI